MAARSYLSILLLMMVVIATSYAEKGDDQDDDAKPNMLITDEVWFDIKVKDFDGPGEDFTGRFVVGLFGDIAPMCTMNFKSLAEGFERPARRNRPKKIIGFRNTPIHRIVPDFIIQMGDILAGDGTGGESIYGSTFVDENFKLSHKAAGYASMANHGEDTNGSQFFITLNRARWLDGKHVVFGKVVKGMEIVRKIGEVSANADTAIPHKKITIVKCGSNKLKEDERYTLTDKQANSGDDL